MRQKFGLNMPINKDYINIVDFYLNDQLLGAYSFVATNNYIFKLGYIIRGSKFAGGQDVRVVEVSEGKTAIWCEYAR